VTEPVSINKIRKAFALALHPETGQEERKAAWIGALRLVIASGFTTLDEFLDAAAPESSDEGYDRPKGWYVVMPFGKHKGSMLGDIANSHPDYFDWLVEQTFRSRRLNEAVKEVLYWQENHGSH
jgi:uncharacterized protein (DUF3820 family)